MLECSGNWLDHWFVITVDQTETSPEQLARSCQAGCPDSFGVLVEQFKNRLYSYLWRFTRNRHDAEDITQETFLRAYRGIHRFDTNHSFSAWIFTIAKRTAINHCRGAKPTDGLSDEHAANTVDPGLALELADEKRSLWSMAKTLKPKQYEALWLRYAEGFSIAEAARIMNTSQVHVKVLLHRARNHLAKRLDRQARLTPVSKPSQTTRRL